MGQGASVVDFRAEVPLLNAHVPMQNTAGNFQVPRLALVKLKINKKVNPREIISYAAN